MDKRFALQLYSLRKDTALDAVAVLKKVAAMGFKSIEFAGYYGFSGKEMAALLTDLGLKAVSSHVGYNRFTDHFKEEVEFNHAVGNTHIVLPAYGMQTLEDAKRAVEDIGKMREAFIREGFEFGYHNHAFEFAPLDETGTTGMDYITSVQDLKLQPDVFWVKTAGLDPVAFIEQNAGRLLSIHMKEYGSDGKNAEFGCGILPWREIMRAAEAGGTSIGILEQEEYSCPPLESVKIGAKNIEKIFH